MALREDEPNCCAVVEIGAIGVMCVLFWQDTGIGNFMGKDAFLDPAERAAISLGVGKA